MAVNWKEEKTNICEKNRIRQEIDAQVHKYLQQGGKIDVLSTREGKPRSAIGSVWRGAEDIPGLGQ